jgi:hypothetical protein
MNRVTIFLVIGILYSFSGKTQTPLRISESSYWIDPATGKSRANSEFRYQYDADGRIRIRQYNLWNDEKKKIGPVSRIEYDYDAMGRESKVRYDYYQNQSDTINSTQIYTTEYDANGRVKVYSITETYFNNPNVYTSTFLYSYTIEGCLIRMDYQARLNGAGSNDYTVIYTVDNQCRTLLKQISFTDPALFPQFETFEYDGGNLVADRIYNVIGSDTLLANEWLYSYNEQNLKVLELQTNSYKREFIYDQAGRLINEKYYPWDYSGQQWNEPTETQNTYNLEGLLAESLSFWSDDGSSYLARYQYDYNSDGKAIRIRFYLSFVYPDYSYEYQNESEINYRCDGEEIGRVFYEFSGSSKRNSGGMQIEYMFPAPCEQQTEQNLSIYPNPTAGSVTIIPSQPLEAYTIRIFNSSGQFIREYTSDQGISPAYMDFSALPSGVYIVTVTGESYFASSYLVRD